MSAEAVVRAVEGILDAARRPAVVVTDRPLGLAADEVTESSVEDVAAAVSDRTRTIVLVTDDVPAFRRSVSRLAGLGKAREVCCVVGDAGTVILPRAHGSWPPLSDIDATCRDDVAATRVELSTRHDARAVFVGLARGSALPVTPGPGGVWTAGDVVASLDPVFAAAYDPEIDCPPDVIVAVDPPTSPPAVTPVLGRAPGVAAVASAGIVLDEAVYNPCGFSPVWARGVVELPEGTVLSRGLIAGLRDAQAVLPGADAAPELLAGLAMCGVPTEVIADPVDRERWSVRTRRDALLQYSAFAWRERLAPIGGVRVDPERLLRRGWVTTTSGEDETDLLLAARYSGADLVIMPDDGATPTERFVPPSETLPAGAIAHRADRTAADIVAGGGLVYLVRAKGRR